MAAPTPATHSVGRRISWAAQAPTTTTAAITTWIGTIDRASSYA